MGVVIMYYLNTVLRAIPLKIGVGEFLFLEKWDFPF